MTWLSTAKHRKKPLRDPCIYIDKLLAQRGLKKRNPKLGSGQASNQARKGHKHDSNLELTLSAMLKSLNQSSTNFEYESKLLKSK